VATQLSFTDAAAAEAPEPSADPRPHALPRLLTAQEVAEILRVPRATVYELARQRRIPYLKVGRRTLFDPVALGDWIKAETVAPRVRSRFGQSR
jgi:excisionase family DNA binding protein